MKNIIKKIRNWILLLLLTGILVFILQGNKVDPIQPHPDCVPDEQTAIKIAEAIWYPLYGDAIFEQKPYYVQLEDGFWIVTGSIPDTTFFGGTAYIKFQKSDCKVVNVYHTK